MTAMAPDDLVRLSGDIIQAGSKSFAAAARLFDRRTRGSAYLLYAWCRHCDDVIDGQDLGFRTGPATVHDPCAELRRLEQLTAAALDGEPMADPVFSALQEVARRHAIPRRYPFELLQGFAMDVEGRRPDTIEDTLTYCYHVAGVVGVMMSIIMGARDEETLDRACDLGLAFQLTNIARDIVDDAACGRIYVPQQWLHEAGIPPAEVADVRHRVALAALAERLLGVAEDYYISSRQGIARLTWRSAWAVATASVVYRKIGREVVRRGPAAWDRRVSTSKLQKLASVLSAAGAAAGAHTIGRFKGPRRQVTLWARPRVHGDVPAGPL
jgi:15-cis-phytoene synthase